MAGACRQRPFGCSINYGSETYDDHACMIRSPEYWRRAEPIRTVKGYTTPHQWRPA